MNSSVVAEIEEAVFTDRANIADMYPFLPVFSSVPEGIVLKRAHI